jgi:FAD/FMN-containing dehydrogenase
MSRESVLSNKPDLQVIAALKAVVGVPGIREQAADLEPHLTEWRGLFQGQTPLMLLPASMAEVSAILKICSANGVAVVPQGGNTGLAGGAIPGLDGDDAQILLS